MSRRNRIVTRLVAFAVVALVATLAASHVSVADQKSKKAHASLKGSWTVTIAGGEGTPVLPDWYKAQVTFTPGGGLVATITDPNIETGHGAWERVGNQKFAITIFLFQFDPAGDFLGTLKARATLKVHNGSQTFDSDNYRFEFVDPDGNPTGLAGVGTAHGTRIKVEP